MSRWEDVVTLIEVVTFQGTDELGYPKKPAEIRTIAYCNRINIGINEFFQAAQSGYKLIGKIEVKAIDYSNQVLAELSGNKYRVLRSYEVRNGEIVELTLSDLSERA